MYVNLYLIFPYNLENRYGVPFTINSLLSDITKMILKYPTKFNTIFFFLSHEMLNRFLHHKISMYMWFNKFDFVISQNQIYDIT